MTDAERYAITVRRVLVEGEELWRATVKELPDLAEFAETRDEAFDLALDSIESLKAAALEDGRPFPGPSDDDEEYGGRVTLRMPKWIHRAAALRAVTEDVSLNWYIVTVLAAHLGERQGVALATTNQSAVRTEGLMRNYIYGATASMRPLGNAMILYDVDTILEAYQPAQGVFESIATLFQGQEVSVTPSTGKLSGSASPAAPQHQRRGETRRRA